jgi:tetratricopeptide (TPR) repeat protein/tRNA A-37 threonylcarbamoyl transferase component Bud32
MDPRHLQRFHNEARAAAGLHHTNIVPVFAVGSERGVHFYAMQLIDGMTLAAAISELRLQHEPRAQATGGGEGEQLTTPHVHGSAGTAETLVRASLSTEGTRRGTAYYRKVAEVGIQAAEALDYAHQMGVVHRDVKPGNLMLDGRGTLWVTDFGLAHLQQAEGNLTMTGDLVGTLRYMSPEQALAKRVVIDHRTDVYSLGATLYEMLTLRPVFAGGDRQELLRQIAFEEPVAPRRLERGIPAELETIVLKAMEKNPVHRYGSAQELASDLERFLKNEPIQARRPSLVQKARKWARRHRPAVAASAAVLVLALLLLGGTGGWLLQRRASAEAEAVRALAEAEEWQQQGRWLEARAAVRRAEGLLIGGGGRVQLRRQAADLLADLAMVERLEEIRLQRSGIKDNAYNNAGADADYAHVFRDYGVDVEALGPEAGEQLRSRPIRVQLASALDDWAMARRLARNKSDATWKSLLAAARAADRDTVRTEVRYAVEMGNKAKLAEVADTLVPAALSANTLVSLAQALRNVGDAGRALVLLRAGQHCYPGDFWLNNTLGELLKGQEGGIRFYTAALALRPESSAAHINLGDVLQRQGKVEEAIACYHRAIAIDPTLAAAHMNLGNALCRQGKVQEGFACYHKAINLEPKYALAHYNLGEALRNQGKVEEAIACYHKAIALDPKFASAHMSLGIALKDKGKVEEAIACYHKAIALDPKHAKAHNKLGYALHKQRKVEEAIACYHKAIALDPKFPFAHSNLGQALLDQGKVEEAIVCYHEATVLDPKDAWAHNNLGAALFLQGKVEEAIACYHRAINLDPRFVLAHNNLGNAFFVSGKLDEAAAAYRKAIEFEANFANPHCSLGLTLKRQGHYVEALQALKRGHELGSRNAGWTFRSAEWVRDTERLAALSDRLPKFVSGEAQPANAADRLALAKMCQDHNKLYAAAKRFYTEAFAAQPDLADNLQTPHRYKAACAAALAGCGQGKDAAELDEKERVRLRTQALDWLRADLDAWSGLLKKLPDTIRPLVIKKMQHRQADPDFAGVRGDALAKLPADERQAWQQLWADVANLLARAKTQAAPAKKPGGK